MAYAGARAAAHLRHEVESRRGEGRVRLERPNLQPSSRPRELCLQGGLALVVAGKGGSAVRGTGRGTGSRGCRDVEPASFNCLSEDDDGAAGNERQSTAGWVRGFYAPGRGQATAGVDSE